MPAKLTVTQDNIAKIQKALRDLSRTTVCVGIPESKTKRRDPDKITNATLGYIHEYGSPANNIPARRWLKPGIEASRATWEGFLQQAATFAMEGRPETVDKALHAAGDTAVQSVKNYITAGISPPLKPRTMAARRAKHRNTKTGPSPLPPQFGGLTPLVDTSQMLNSITYTVVKK